MHNSPQREAFLSLIKPDWLIATRFSLLSRILDRLEVETLAPQGKIKYQFSACGHELAQVLLAQALDHPHDAAIGYYRSRPFMLASGFPLNQALAAGMARASQLSEGRDAGVVFNRPRLSGLTILPSSGNVGAQYTPAAGWAQAVCYWKSVLHDPAWEGAIAVAMGGDGSVAANGFWAALNIVTPLCLPMLFFIEDNGFGLSVPSYFQNPEGNIARNLTCYGNLRVLDANGSDPAEAWSGIQESVAHVRSGSGPCLLRMRVPRLTGHTFVDSQAYKTAEQRADEAARDPIPRLQSYLIENNLLDQAGWQLLSAEVEQELEKALQEVEGIPEPAPSTVSRHIFYEGLSPQQGGLRPDNAQIPLGSSTAHPSGARVNLVDAVRRVLQVEISRNPRLLVFGEDVGVKGGVHGATQDLQTQFGEERVFDTSLSEDGIIGRSVGLALAGLLPAPEIQFRKYADPAHEQISDLGTLRWRTANRFAAPLVIRIPVGFSKKTGDPWHSMSGEAIYAHLTGWRIAYPSNAEDAVGLLRSALRGDDPTFFFEHRALLDSVEGRRPYPGDDYCLPFGIANRVTQGDELTLVTWGAMLPRCMEAIRDFPGRITLIDLRTIIPWDKQAVLESLHQTGKVLIVHEDTLTTGFGAEIAAVIAEEAFTDLDAPVMRLGVPDVPIPYNLGLMDTILPNVELIRSKVAELSSY